MLKKIDKMIALYGARSGLHCAACPHLVRVNCGARTHYKCRAYGVTGSAASDWCKKWPACKLLGQKLPERPAMQIDIEKEKKVPAVLDGQISMF